MKMFNDITTVSYIINVILVFVAGLSFLGYFKKGRMANYDETINLYKSLNDGLDRKIKSLEDKTVALESESALQAKKIVDLENINKELFKNINTKPYLELRSYLDSQFTAILGKLESREVKVTI